jgi:hypothetical protein
MPLTEVPKQARTSHHMRRADDRFKLRREPQGACARSGSSASIRVARRAGYTPSHSLEAWPIVTKILAFGPPASARVAMTLISTVSLTQRSAAGALR